MARPKKDNADYFSHDADMRNDPKIKAIRKKFGFMGYAIWCFLLETLTDSDFFQIEWSELNQELLSGDYMCESSELIDIINYCEKIQLLTVENGVLYSDKLKNRFESLLSKRKRDRTKVIVSENPYIKVKEIKREEIKVKENTFLNNENSDSSINPIPISNRQEEMKKHLLSQQIWIEQIAMTPTFKGRDIPNLLLKFLDEQILKENLFKPERELKNHFINWLKTPSSKITAASSSVTESMNRILNRK